METENEMKAPKIEKIDLSKIKNPLLVELVEAGLITEQGFRVSGNGMIVRKLEKIWSQLDKNGLKLYKLQQDMQKFVKLRS